MTTPKSVKNSKFSAMCSAVGSGSTSKFPLELPFASGRAAQSFRCEFYAYRRSLQKDTAAQFDPDRIIELEGANALEIARIDYDSVPSVLTIRLRMQRPAFQKAYNVLDGLFAQEQAKGEGEAEAQIEAQDTPAPILELHRIETAQGTYVFHCEDNPPRSDATYLIQIKRGNLKADFHPASSTN